MRIISGDIEGCAIISCGQTREFTSVKDNSGKYSSLEPVPNSDRSYIQLRLPNGTVIQAEVSNENFNNEIAHLWDHLWVDPPI